jgi:hypothetical protein
MAEGAERDEVDEHRGERRASWLNGPWFWVPLLLFVVYPLSIGPAALLVSKVRSARPAFDMVYAPILFLCKKSEGVDDLFEHYVDEVWQATLGYPL